MAKEFYSGARAKEYHVDKRAVPPEAEPWIAELRASKIQPHVANNAVIFEYGVGYGWNLQALRCARKMGCDVSDLLEQETRQRGIEFFYKSESVADQTADVVLCHHTLEHLLEPAKALLEMRRILKNSGKLLLFVPQERACRYNRFDEREPNHHLFSWNPQTLGNLIEQCGFSFEAGGLRAFRFDRFAAISALRFGLGRKGYFFIRKLALLAAPEHEIWLAARKNET